MQHTLNIGEEAHALLGEIKARTGLKKATIVDRLVRQHAIELGIVKDDKKRSKSAAQKR